MVRVLHTHHRLRLVIVAAVLLAMGGMALAQIRTPSTVRPVSARLPSAESTTSEPAAPTLVSTPRRCPGEETLARVYAPALALAADGQAPRPVEMLLDRARIVYQDGDQMAEEARVDAARLAALRSHPEAYLTLPPAIDDRAAQRRIYDEAVASDKTGRYAVTAYARVHCAATTAGLEDRTVIQYWLFYLYNDYVNTHEGDWELVQIVLDGQQRPLYAAYAQHNTYSWRRWDEVLTDTRDTDGDGIPEEHPRVYVARGSNASFFQYKPDGYGGDQVADAREFIIPSVRMLPGPDEQEPAFGWLRFTGRWGKVPGGAKPCPSCNSGPVGPMYNSNGAKWNAPLEWGGQRLTRDDLAANGIARVVVVGNVRTHAYDGQNRHTGPLVSGRLEVGIPGSAHLTRPGTRQTTLLLPGFTERTPGRIEIEGGEIKALKLLLPGGSAPLELSFPGVALGQNGTARLELGKGAPVLQVDADGDGRYERVVQPQTPLLGGP